MEGGEDYRAYLQNMEGIYNDFPRRLLELKEHGTEAEKMVRVREGCIALVFRHDDGVAQPLADLSARIGQEVPAMIYSVPNIQTTVVACKVSPGYWYHEGDACITELLVQAVHRALERFDTSLLEGRRIEFRKPLFSRGVVMAPGYPNYPQWALLTAITEEVSRPINYGECFDHSAFRPPWGSQCVVARFLDEVPAAGVQGLLKLASEAQAVGQSKPSAIDVVTNEVDEHGVQVTTTRAHIEL